MVRNALEETVADISVVRGGLRLSVTHGRAAVGPATMSVERPVVLVVGIADGELIVERVIDPEKPSPDVDLVIVVRTPPEAVGPQLVAVERRDVGNHKGC